MLSFLSVVGKYLKLDSCGFLMINIRLIVTLFFTLGFLITAMWWIYQLEYNVFRLTSKHKDYGFGNTDPVFFLKTLYKFKILILLAFFNHNYEILKFLTYISMNKALSAKSIKQICIHAFHQDFISFNEDFQSSKNFILIINETENIFSYFFCCVVPLCLVLLIQKGELELIKERSNISTSDIKSGEVVTSYNIKGLKFSKGH